MRGNIGRPPPGGVGGGRRARFRGVNQAGVGFGGVKTDNAIVALLPTIVTSRHGISPDYHSVPVTYRRMNRTESVRQGIHV